MEKKERKKERKKIHEIDLLFDDWALMVEAFENKTRELFDNTDMRRAKKVANLLQFVNRSDLVFVRSSRVDHPRPPIRFHGSPAGIHC